MKAKQRYEVVDTIAHGDFATVYRGFDLELNREVAIKQIHPQYLSDPKKLERYWQEAQLLASLEHPYIMTIYDIVRDRGWLILELMQGSLKQKLGGEPIDVEDLRLTIIYMAHALGFLHKNGIVHGDVKPNNLLLDKNHRVKLGDFGIARRLAGDDGSVIKGTTKYMAPEVFSDQFGPVGHHSDLYSLGFSSYELLCGDHFDSLFPGLNMFGRDPQVAWMMWHHAKDRSVPEIDRVLEGVPKDLSKVIHQLCQKDPGQHYLTAEDVIFDLKSHSEGQDPEALKQAAAELEQQEETKKKKKRVYLYVALAASLLLSVVVALLPGPSEPTPIAPPSYPRAGVLADLDLERQLMGVTVDPRNPPVGIQLDSTKDRYFLNDEKSTLDQLATGDELVIELVSATNNTDYYIIEASRKEMQSVTHAITAVDSNNGTIMLSAGAPLEVYVPVNVTIRFNGRDDWDGRSTKVDDLRAGDTAAVQYVIREGRNEVRKIEVTRLTSIVGILDGITKNGAEISVRATAAEDRQLRTLPVAPDCQVTLNGDDMLASGKQVSIATLHPGDEVTVLHDDLVREVVAVREMSSTGQVIGIDLTTQVVTVDLDDPANRRVDFRLADDCQIGLSESGEARELTFLRPGDRLEIEHDSPDFEEPFARALHVDPLPNTDMWAVVVGFDQFDDEHVSPIPNSLADAEMLERAMLDYYRVPPQQLKMLANPTRLTLTQELEEFALELPANAQWVVYVSSRGYATENGVPVIATRELDFGQLSATGLPLRDLLEPIEQSAAREKILVLDTCHRGTEQDIRQQLSSAELALASRRSANHPVSSTATVIASCSDGEVNQTRRDSANGLFATLLADAYRGAGDADGDYWISSDELVARIDESMLQENQNRRIAQTPTRFVPDPNPIRVYPETRDAVAALLGYLQQSRYEESVTDAYQTARDLQPDMPDASVVYGLINLKHHRTAESRNVFEQVRGQYSDVLIPELCLAWQYATGKEWVAAISELNEMVTRMPIPGDADELNHLQALVYFAGQMTEFAITCADPILDPGQIEKLTQSVGEIDSELQDAFAAGRLDVANRRDEIDLTLNDVQSSVEANRLIRDRRRLAHFTKLDYEQLAEFVRYRLEH